MWSSERRRLIAALAALPTLAACGFAPTLASGGAAAELRGRIRADDPDNPDGFAFVERLEERFGRPDAPRYALSFDIDVTTDDIATVRGEGATRGTATGRVRYAVRHLEDDDTVHEGRAESFTGWSKTEDALAERIAREDARGRLMRILADRIATDLTATAGDWAAP